MLFDTGNRAGSGPPNHESTSTNSRKSFGGDSKSLPRHKVSSPDSKTMARSMPLSRARCKSEFR